MAVEFNARVMSDGWLKVAVWYVPTTSRRKEAEIYINGSYYDNFFVEAGETGDNREFNVNRDYRYGEHTVEVKFDGSWIRHEDGDWKQKIYFGDKGSSKKTIFTAEYDEIDHSLYILIDNIDISSRAYAEIWIDGREEESFRVYPEDTSRGRTVYVDDYGDGRHTVTVYLDGNPVAHRDGGYSYTFVKKTIKPPGPNSTFEATYYEDTDEVEVFLKGMITNGNRLDGDIFCDGRRYHQFRTETTSRHYEEFSVSDLSGTHEFSVYIEGEPVLYLNGGYRQSLYVGDKKVPLFDIAFNEDSDNLKVSVWDVDTSRYSVEADVYIDDKFVGDIIIDKGINGADGYFPTFTLEGGVHYCSVKINGSNIKSKPGPIKLPFTIKDRGVKSIKLISIDWGDFAPTIYFYADGNGYVDIYSKTRREYIATKVWVSEGHGTYEFSNSQTGWLDGKYSMPAGTCFFSKDGKPISYNPDSFYVVRNFEFTSFDREYSIDIQRRGYNAIEMSAVTQDWILLINGLYYISSAIDGYFGDVNYSNFFPEAGKVITARMYNTLIDITKELGQKINYGSSLPEKVSSGEVISRNFIKDIGDVYNTGIKYLQTVNSSLGR